MSPAEQMQQTGLFLNWVLVVAQVATLVALIAYVYHTAKMASTMKATYEAQTRPYVMVYADVLPDCRVDLVIANVGRGPAKDVTVSMTPDPLGLRHDLLKAFLTRGLAWAPPGWETRCVWTTGPNIKDLPDKTFRARVRYLDPTTRREFSEENTIVLEELEPIALRGRKPLHEIAGELSHLRDQLNQGVVVTGPPKTDYSGALPVRLKSVPPEFLAAVRPATTTPAISRRSAPAPWECRPVGYRVPRDPGLHHGPPTSPA
ncbi:MAG: hypothetical protein FJX75_24130 [Armatimonadetes bacterium]|nr:hypothetical protein [Armatimonadota bacterium]